MRFHLATLFFFLMAMVFNTSHASPIMERGTELSSLANLVERDLSFPVTPDDTLVAKIMAAVKADLNVKVFADITANICEKIKAGLQVDAKVLGGVISIDDLEIKAIQSAVIKNLKVNLDATVKADVDANVYVPLEAGLRKLLGSTPLTKEQLLKVLVDLEVQAKALVKVELPKLEVALKAKIKEEIQLAINKATVNIPPIVKVDIKVNVDEKVTVDVCIDIAVKACLAIDVNASAQAILNGL